jgi:hypothetical protein
MADSLWRGVIDEDPYLPNTRSAIILQLKICIEHTFALLLHSAPLPPQAHVKWITRAKTSAGTPSSKTARSPAAFVGPAAAPTCNRSH